MKKMSLLGICLIIIISSQSFEKCIANSACPITQKCEKAYELDKNNPKNFENYIRRIQRQRATLYNALDLSDEQIKTNEDMIKENAPKYEKLFEELNKETLKLKALKEANSSEKEILAQKKTVKNIQKNIETLLNSENKNLKKTLTHEQCSKYSIIRKLSRNDYKKSLHPKNLYKSNPKMTPFGNPKKI